MLSARIGRRVLLLTTCLFPLACGDTGDGKEATDDHDVVDSTTAFCPAGTTFDKAFRMCSSPTEAVGPFSNAMIATCKSGGGGDACDKGRWDRALAEGIRGRGQCLPGTTIDAGSGFCASGDDAFGPFPRALVTRCKAASDADAVCETMRWSKEFVADTRGLKPSDVFCPLGTTYDAEHRLCASADEAVGPFTEGMIDGCIGMNGGADTCQASRWNAGFAKSIRGTGRCPPGAALDPETGYCREGDNLFGPFTRQLVERCRAGGGGAPCEGMRWRKSFVTGAGEANPAGLPSCAPARAVGAVNRFERALLDVIAFAEGTRGFSQDGYDVTFGFHLFSKCQVHPRNLVCSGPLCSDAAGRYQFLSTTGAETGLPTFTPDNQDRGAMKRVAFRGGRVPVNRPLSSGEFSDLMDQISFEWASLPPGRFGQPNRTLSEMRSEYCRVVGGC